MIRRCNMLTEHRSIVVLCGYRGHQNVTYAHFVHCRHWQKFCCGQLFHATWWWWPVDMARHLRILEFAAAAAAALLPRGWDENRTRKRCHKRGYFAALTWLYRPYHSLTRATNFDERFDEGRWWLSDETLYARSQYEENRVASILCNRATYIFPWQYSCIFRTRKCQTYQPETEFYLKYMFRVTSLIT